MLWQYRCGSPCEMKFISVVCGLAVIQKQPRLVDRAFNRASPSDCLPGSAPDLCLPSSLPFLTAPFPSYSLLSPYSLTLSFWHSKQLLSTHYTVAALLISPGTLTPFYSMELLTALHTHTALCSREFPPWGIRSHTHFPPCAPWSHTPSGTSMNKSYC